MEDRRCGWGIYGSSKTSRGGWNKVGEHAQEVCVWNEKYHDGKINFYQDIVEYIKWCSYVAGSGKRFFLAINPSADIPQKFFKLQPVEKNFFMGIVKNV